MEPILNAGFRFTVIGGPPMLKVTPVRPSRSAMPDVDPVGAGILVIPGGNPGLGGLDHRQGNAGYGSNPLSPALPNCLSTTGRRREGCASRDSPATAPLATIRRLPAS